MASLNATRPLVLVGAALQVGAAVFDALLFGLQQLQAIGGDVQVQQVVGQVHGQVRDQLFADDVFFGHG